MVDEQDGLLPIANVSRIMKQILPPTAKISKEAKQTVQECATEFISFVTGEASNKCHKENRKTLNGEDICWALSTLGLDDHADAALGYLNKYREAERKRSSNQTRRIYFRNEEVTSSKFKQRLGAPIPLEFDILEKGSSSRLFLERSS